MKKVIIVGSAGSPNQAIEILKINQKLEIPVIICIHFTSSAMETFANHIKSETGNEVNIVSSTTYLKPGIYLPEGGKDMVFIEENIVNVIDETVSSETIHPSISALFKSLQKYANKNFIIIVLGGLGDDGSKYAKILRDSGVRFIVEKFPKFSYLPNNIAIQLGERYEKFEIEKIKEVLKSINTKER
ncbi:chemotaxis protein CheB [Fervidobacterium sp.]